MWQMIQKIVKPDIAKKQGRIRRKIGLGIPPFCVSRCPDSGFGWKI